MKPEHAQANTDYTRELRALAALSQSAVDSTEDPRDRSVLATLRHMQESGATITLGNLSSRLQRKRADTLKVAERLLRQFAATQPIPQQTVDLLSPSVTATPSVELVRDVRSPINSAVIRRPPSTAQTAKGRTDWTLLIHQIPPEKLRTVKLTPLEARIVGICCDDGYHGMSGKEFAAATHTTEGGISVAKVYLKKKLAGLLGLKEPEDATMRTGNKVPKTDDQPSKLSEPVDSSEAVELDELTQRDSAAASSPILNWSSRAITNAILNQSQLGSEGGTDNARTSNSLARAHNAKIPLLDRQTLLNRIAEHLEYYLDVKDHPLRPKQVVVVRDVIAALRAGRWGGSIIRPTGTGKTVIFSAVAQALQELREELLEEHHTVDGFGFLILVPTTYLAEQTYRTMVEDKRENGRLLFGFPKEDVAVMRSHESNAEKGEALAASNLIMTYDYFNSLSKRAREELQERFFTVMDEVDVAKGNKRTPLFNNWTKDNFTLGFSATEKFIEGEEIRSINDVLFESAPPLHKTTLAEAARDSEISPIRNVLFVTNLDSGIERRIRGKNREYTQDELASIVDQPGRDDAAIGAIAKFVDPNNGIAFKDLNQIWFCLGVSHAARIAARLNTIYQQPLPDGRLRYPYGYAVSVSSETPKEDWVDESTGIKHMGLYSLLEKHRQGEIPVLCNADLLIRGYDSPLTQLCVMLRPTRSPTLTEQAGGRIGRLDPNNPDKLGYVATFFDKDTASAMCFTDVAGSVFIGPEGQESKKSFKSGIKEKRTPNLGAMNVDKKVEVITIFEPRRIEQFLREKRQPKVNGVAQMPPDFVSVKMMAREQGLPSRYYQFEPHQTLVRLHNEAMSAERDSLTFKHPKTGHEIPISMSHVGYYLPPSGGGGYQLCLKRSVAEKVLVPSSAYPRLSPDFITFHEAEYTPKDRKKFIDLYLALSAAYASQVEWATFKPASLIVEWLGHRIRLPTDAVKRFDTSQFYGVPGRDKIGLHSALMPSVHALLSKEAPVTDTTSVTLLKDLAEVTYAANLQKFGVPLLSEKPADSFGIAHQSTAIRNHILANLPHGYGGTAQRFLNDDSLCPKILERIEHAWVYYASSASKEPRFVVPTSRLIARDSIELNPSEFGYYYDPNLLPHERFFITRQGISGLAQAICGQQRNSVLELDWSGVLDQKPLEPSATTEEEVPSDKAMPHAPAMASRLSPIASTETLQAAATSTENLEPDEAPKTTQDGQQESPLGTDATALQGPPHIPEFTPAESELTGTEATALSGSDVIPFTQRVRRGSAVFPARDAIKPERLAERPQKTDDWFGTYDMANETRRSIVFLANLYRALQPAWEEAIRRGDSTFSAEGLTLDTNKAGIFERNSGKSSMFCVHRDYQDTIQNHKPSPNKPGFPKDGADHNSAAR